jgi:penicillin-binding protein 1A
MGKKVKILILVISILILVPVSFLGYVFLKATREASSRIDKGAIDRIIASESPVYYDDGHTPIGVFFEKTHRKYIKYDEIPDVFIKALVAAEDRNFFTHLGFDPKSMLRALVANLRAGRVVQGGSTITQQTAKNIFKREKKSYEAKLKEVIQSFLLERRFSKEEILEMYANQFLVTGYGKGLKIAAQYYFGKDSKDLDLVEAAFIVGSVKGPNRYNPFIKKNQAEKEKARRLAKLRKDYVLSKMLALNFITNDQYLLASEKEIPFKEGKITYRLNVILDYIRQQLESDYFREVLQEEGIENFATSGISIYTSLHKETQEAALNSLRTHLPLMDIQLNGLEGGRTEDIPDGLIEKGPRTSEGNLPFLARISSISRDDENGHLVVSWENGGGTIDYEGLKGVAGAWLKWKSGPWAVFEKKDVPKFLENLRVGDLVAVQMAPSSQTSKDDKASTRLTLSKIPQLEGGIVVLHKGMIKAMAGGFLDRFFNRAVDAKRQLGSIFKPIVYAAALQLKWNNLDPLKNVRDIFRFENTYYLPRPDHTPQSQEVSMAWAGANSENLATVWLIYHLTENLNMSEFRQVANIVGLDRNKGETYQDYTERIRDRHGVLVNKEALMEAAFEEARKEIESDLLFGGQEEVLKNLRRLHFKIESSLIEAETPEERQLLRYSFIRLLDLDEKMRERFQKIRILRNQYAEEKNPMLWQELSRDLDHFYRTQGKEPRVVFMENPEGPAREGLIPVTPEWVTEDPAWSREKIWIDGLVTSGSLDLIQGHIRDAYERLLAYKPYDFEVLCKIRDFRTLVNLSYVVYLCERIGIATRLDPVLSFPLGPNSISILEAAVAYQSLITGQVYPLSPDGGLNMVPLITKIVDREGEIIWEYEPKPERVLSPRVSSLVTEILRKVMQVGTGRKARDAVMALDIPIPTLGKTGTADQFTNSGFVGLVPGPDETTGQLDLNEGYVIAAYVGYDDNRPMKAKNFAIYGSSGALPLWIDTANAITGSENYAKALQLADLVFGTGPNLIPIQGNLKVIPVSKVTGLPSGIPSPYGVIGEVEDSGGVLVFKRCFEPVGGKAQ